MAKKYFIIAGLLIVSLGGAAFGFEKFVNQKAEQEIEQKLSLGTGLATDCTKANVNLLQNNVHFMDIKVNNMEGFSSPYIFRINSIDVQAKSLLKQPLEIEKIVIEDVAVNVDVQFNNNATTPESMMAINLKQLSEKGKNAPSQDSEKPDDLNINQMQFNNIKFTINLRLPGGENKTPITKEFEINQITLEQVTGKNLPDKLSSALQGKILTEITSLSNEQNLPSILEQLNKIKLPSPPSQPQKPSLPSPASPPSQPQKPSLPSPPSPPSQPQKPSLPSPSQPKNPSLPSPPSPLSQPQKPSLPSPASPPSPLSQPQKPSLPSPASPPSPLSQPNKPSPPFPPI